MDLWDLGMYLQVFSGKSNMQKKKSFTRSTEAQGDISEVDGGEHLTTTPLLLRIIHWVGSWDKHYNKKTWIMNSAQNHVCFPVP